MSARMKPQGLLLPSLLLGALCSCQSFHDRVTGSIDHAEAIDFLDKTTEHGDVLDPTSATIDQIKKPERDALVETWMTKSGQACTVYKGRLIGLSRDSRLFTDLSSGALSGLATIFKSLSVVHPLTGAATILTGAGSAISNDLFAQQTGDVLAKAIDTARQSQANVIEMKLVLPVTDYNVYRARRDVQEYHDMCSIETAFAQIKTSLSLSAPDGGASPPASQGTQQTPLTPAQNSQRTALIAAGAATGVANAPNATAGQVANAINGALAAGAIAASAPASPAAANTAASVAAIAATLPIPPAVAPTMAAAPVIDVPAVADIARVQLALVKNRTPTRPVVDGVLGKWTSKAVQEFQASMKPPIAGSGIITPETEKALGLTTPPSTAYTAPTAAQIRIVQHFLVTNVLAPIDSVAMLKTPGVMNAATVAALVAYQDEHSLPPTGVIDSATASSLHLTY